MGTFAFEISNSCTYNQFVKNTLSHLGGGEFRANGGAFGSNPLEPTGFNVYTDNTISYYGQTFASSMGIFHMHSQGNLISHNLIQHGYKNAIATGRFWGYLPSVSRDYIIEYNHIHHIGFGEYIILNQRISGSIYKLFSNDTT